MLPLAAAELPRILHLILNHLREMLSCTATSLLQSRGKAIGQRLSCHAFILFPIIVASILQMDVQHVDIRLCAKEEGEWTNGNCEFCLSVFTRSTVTTTIQRTRRCNSRGTDCDDTEWARNFSIRTISSGIHESCWSTVSGTICCTRAANRKPLTANSPLYEGCFCGRGTNGRA